MCAPCTLTHTHTHTHTTVATHPPHDDKCDVLDGVREVTEAEGRAKALAFGCPFMESSAKCQLRVEAPFHDVVRQVRRLDQRKEETTSGAEEVTSAGGGGGGGGGDSKTGACCTLL